jgi:hypothetical protein
LQVLSYRDVCFIKSIDPAYTVKFKGAKRMFEDDSSFTRRAEMEEELEGAHYW